MINISLRRIAAATSLAIVGGLATVVGVTTNTTASADCFLGFVGDTCIQEESQRVAQGDGGCWIFCPVEEPAKEPQPWVWGDENGGPTQPKRRSDQENRSGGKDCNFLGVPISCPQG